MSDRDLVQAVLAHRIFTPRAGITLSTRERKELRDNMIPLGITNLSAGVHTGVGTHSDDIEDKGENQFEIADDRSVEDMYNRVKELGFQPIFKNWMHI